MNFYKNKFSASPNKIPFKKNFKLENKNIKTINKIYNRKHYFKENLSVQIISEHIKSFSDEQESLKEKIKNLEVLYL